MILRNLTIPLLLITFYPNLTWAFDYEPPPMFNHAVPKAVTPPQEIPSEKNTAPAQPIVNAPKPTQKPFIKKQHEVLNESIKETLEPIDLIVKETPKLPSKGVVKGPKTMPAVQKETVHEEVTFEAKSKQPPSSLLERFQKTPTVNKKVDKAVDNKLPRNIPKTLSKAQKEVSLFFSNEQELSVPTEPLADILLFAQQNPDRLIYVESYAVTDPSLALQRALKTRSYLLSKQILPYRVNVLARDNRLATPTSDHIVVKIE